MTYKELLNFLKQNKDKYITWVYYDANLVKSLKEGDYFKDIDSYHPCDLFILENSKVFDSREEIINFYKSKGIPDIYDDNDKQKPSSFFKNSEDYSEGEVWINTYRIKDTTIKDIENSDYTKNHLDDEIDNHTCFHDLYEMPEIGDMEVAEDMIDVYEL